MLRWQIILGLVSTTAAGFVAGYFFGKKKSADRIAELEEQNEALREKLEQAYDDYDEIEDILDNRDFEIEELRKMIPGSDETVYKKQDKPNIYRRAVAEVEEQNEDEEEDGEEQVGEDFYNDLLGIDETQAKAEADGKPYYISEDDFNDTNTHWDKEVLHFYKNGVVTNEEDLLTDADGTMRWVDMLEGLNPSINQVMSIHHDTVWVRKPRWSTDFEIYYIDTEYTEDLMI